MAWLVAASALGHSAAIRLAARKVARITVGALDSVACDLVAVVVFRWTMVAE
jgi:hypothetical protein